MDHVGAVVAMSKGTAAAKQAAAIEIAATSSDMADALIRAIKRKLTNDLIFIEYRRKGGAGSAPSLRLCRAAWDGTWEFLKKITPE